MLAKRLHFVLAVLVVSLSTCCFAQKADIAFTLGGTFVSDSKVNVLLLTPCPGPGCNTSTGTIQSGHHIYLEGTPALQLLSVKVASLYVEVPIAAIPSQNLHLTSSISTTNLRDLSSLFVTPALRLKVLPGSPISPFVSVGGGVAHYSLGSGSNNKGVLQYGGGLDFKTGIPFLGFRAEVRDFVSSDPNFGNAINTLLGINNSESGLHRHNVLAGGGVVLRF
jgi:hypothetical protein